MSVCPTLTPAQQKALDWLPSDGAARVVDIAPPVEVSYFRRDRPDLLAVRIEYVDVIGRHFPVSYRLTPKGIAYKAGREG